MPSTRLLHSLISVGVEMLLLLNVAFNLAMPAAINPILVQMYSLELQHGLLHLSTRFVTDIIILFIHI